MSLVGKYSRRDDDDEEEAPGPEKMVVVEQEVSKKKREATYEVKAPEAKKAKLSEPNDDKLELPDFFKTDVTVKASSSAPVASRANISQSAPTKLVPRQLRYADLSFLVLRAF